MKKAGGILPIPFWSVLTKRQQSGVFACIVNSAWALRIARNRPIRVEAENTVFSGDFVSSWSCVTYNFVLRMTTCFEGEKGQDSGAFRHVSRAFATCEVGQHPTVFFRKRPVLISEAPCRVAPLPLSRRSQRHFLLYFAPFRVRNRSSKWQAKRPFPFLFFTWSHRLSPTQIVDFRPLFPH